MDEPELLRGRIAARLEIVDALLWAVSNSAQLLDLVKASASGHDALDVLTGPEIGLSEFAAHHVLDLTFRRLSAENVRLLYDERDRLLRGEDTATVWKP